MWWPDEELSPEELEQAEDLFARHKPTIMISHECPSSVATIILEAEAASLAPTGCLRAPPRACSACSSGTVPGNGSSVTTTLTKTLALECTTFRCCAELSRYELEIDRGRCGVAASA